MADVPTSREVRPVVMRTPESDPWLFTTEEVEKSPSRYAGISREFENECYARATIYIRECSGEMQLPALTVVVAATFMRRFFMLESVVEHDMAHVSSACLFLACKVSETHKRLRDFIHHTVVVRTRDLRVNNEGLDVYEGSNKFETERNAMLKKEAEVMRILNFDLTVDHPFKHLPLLCEHYLNTLGKEEESEEERSERIKMAKQTAWNFLVESIGTYVHIRFDAREVTTAAVFLGVRYADLPIQCSKPGAPRYYDLYNCDVAHIEEICIALLNAVDPDHSKFA